MGRPKARTVLALIALAALHADGTLQALSMESFGVDLATATALFDLDAIGQVVP